MDVAEAEVASMVEVVVMEEEEVILVTRINTEVHMVIKVNTKVDTRIKVSSKAIFNVGIARSLVTKKLIVGPSREMSKDQTLLKMFKKRVSYS